MIFCHEAYDGDVYSIDWWVTVTKKGLYTDLFDGEQSDFETREEIYRNAQRG